MRLFPRLIRTAIFAAGLLAVTGAGLGCASPRGRAIDRAPAGETFGPEPADLLRLLDERLFRVREFRLIREWARARGVRLFLAGGTAAGAAHYVLDDAEREWLASRRLPQKYSAYRFQYNYYDIYRSTQDADLVLDGAEADARALEAFLRERLDYLQGSKSIWEVRLLRHSRGSGIEAKDALLGNPDFLDQNSDSHSTGLVELTDPPSGEGRVRDLFDWENRRDPRFLRDILGGKLHFYRNPGHHRTARFVKGWNPEIVSVLRYFTKAFQYGLAIDPADAPALREIIRAFDPADPALSAPAKRYIASHATKILQHAEDIEAASAALDEFGLREKLARLATDSGVTSLRTLLARQPLRSYPLGHGPGIPGKAGTGRTAEELGLSIAAHETRDFLAYESITRSRSGKPNVYQSIAGNADEEAAFGSGFYTRIGRQGARGTGITVRYVVSPGAVDGRDFLRDGDYLIFVNANALRTIDENFALGPRELMTLIEEQTFDENDRGFFEKLRLRLQTLTVPETERAETRKRFNSWVRERFLRSRPNTYKKSFADAEREKLFLYLDSGFELDRESAALILGQMYLHGRTTEETELAVRVIDASDLLRSPDPSRLLDRFHAEYRSDILLRALFSPRLDFKRPADQRLLDEILKKRTREIKGFAMHPLSGFTAIVEDPRLLEHPRWFEFLADYLATFFADPERSLHETSSIIEAIYAIPAFQAHPRFIEVTRAALDRLSAQESSRTGLNWLLTYGIMQPEVAYHPSLHGDAHIRKTYLERLPNLSPFLKGPGLSGYPPEVWALVGPSFDYNLDLLKRELDQASGPTARQIPRHYSRSGMQHLLAKSEFVFADGGLERAISALRLLVSRCDFEWTRDHPLTLLVSDEIERHPRWLDYYRAMKAAGVLETKRAPGSAPSLDRELEALQGRVRKRLDAAEKAESAARPPLALAMPRSNPMARFRERCVRLLQRLAGRGN